MRKCQIEGCQQKHRARGWCGTHYSRWLIHGDPLIVLRAVVPSLAERFWSRVDKTDDCWLWTGPHTIGGYGQFQQTTAHRISWELTYDAIPDGLQIDHLCRVLLCVNPAHLEVVTPAENRKRSGDLITHCPRGHEYTPENTYRRVDAKGWRHRMCRECNREKHRSRKPS